MLHVITDEPVQDTLCAQFRQCALRGGDDDEISSIGDIGTVIGKCRGKGVDDRSDQRIIDFVELHPLYEETVWLQMARYKFVELTGKQCTNTTNPRI